MSKAYLCHRATDLNKVVPKARRLMLTPDYVAKHYIIEAKHDGCQAVITLEQGKEPLVQSRTGEVYVGPLPAARVLMERAQVLLEQFGSVVIFAEAWWPGKDQFPAIAGAFKRRKENDQLKLIIFDMVTLDAFNEGKWDMPYSQRRKHLHHMSLAGQEMVYRPQARDPGTFTGDAMVELSRDLVAHGGFDGVVAKLPDGVWVKDHKGGDQILKIKAIDSLDLKVTDVFEEPGEKTGRPVFSIEVEYQGLRSRVGSGMPHDRAKVPSIGAIVEIECLGLTPDGKLREPRYKGERIDKLEPDQ